MAPIRVGIVGLSQNAQTSWGGRAHFPYLIGSDGKYEITALLNSSKDSAQKAIDSYNLPSTTKAYGDPQDLANDPDIDLVVCATRVDVHYPTIKPSIEAGKDVFVEWPLASNAQDAEELTNLANSKKIKTVIGLQGRVSPIYLKIKDLIESGKIGKLLSSTITLSGGAGGRDSIPEGLAYFFDRKVGGNIVTIAIGHLSDALANVLGPIKLITSNLSNIRPSIKVLSPPSKDPVRTIKSDVPDRIHIEGLLPSYDNAPITFFFRRGPQFKNTLPLIWSLEGEAGEIRVEAEGTGIQVDVKTTISVESFATGEVENVSWEDGMAERGFKGPAKNIGSLYEAFAEGKGKYPTFDDALERHRFLEAVFGDWV